MNTITMESKAFHFWGDNVLGRNTIILITGKAGVGKTTVANFLSLHIPKELTVRIKGFADELKVIARESFGWDYQKSSRGRKLLQQIGFIGREYNENIWIDKLMQSINSESYLFPDILIIDDWRFINEAEYFSDHLYDIIKIKITSTVRGGLDGGLGKDISETELDNYPYYTYVLENNSLSLKELDKECKKLVNILMKEN